MRFRCNRILPFLGGLVLAYATVGAEIRITDVVTFGADPSGSFGGQSNIWETRPGGNFDNWIQQGANGGPFLNGPTETSVQPNITLALGENSFRFFSTPGIEHGHFGINLFFDGATTPSISAFTPMLTDSSQAHQFFANGAGITPGPTIATQFEIVPGANTLSFVAGDQLIELTDFYWASPSVYQQDLIGGHAIQPDGVREFVGGITLSVTLVPEPTVVTLGALSAGCIWLFYRSRKRSG